MKNISLILSGLAFLGVLILFGFHFRNDKTIGMSASGSKQVTGTGHIAFVNIDTLESHYDYLKTKKIEFQKRQDGMKAELQQSEVQMQSDVATVQRKAQAGTLTEPEYQAAQKRIGQMQQSLKTREEILTQQLMKEQEEFNSDLQKRLDTFLNEYNKDKKYDYIFSYTRSGPIMFANKDLDITADVVKGMNDMAKKLNGDAEKNK